MFARIVFEPKLVMALTIFMVWSAMPSEGEEAPMCAEARNLARPEGLGSLRSHAEPGAPDVPVGNLRLRLVRDVTSNDDASGGHQCLSDARAILALRNLPRDPGDGATDITEAAAELGVRAEAFRFPGPGKRPIPNRILGWRTDMRARAYFTGVIPHDQKDPALIGLMHCLYFRPDERVDYGQFILSGVHEWHFEHALPALCEQMALAPAAGGR